MGRVAVVTGYAPIPNHPRRETIYHQLASNLNGVHTALHRMYCRVEETWLWQVVAGLKEPVRHAEGDNPAKNTLAYNCVQHQKTQWMLEAMEKDKQTDIFVWIDYGIFHQPGISLPVIEDFLRKVRGETEIAIPGAWERDAIVHPVVDEQPCWRFCGSTLICHRRYLSSLHDAIRNEARSAVERGMISWEVNTWAKVERSTCLPIRWYKGDHNATQFTGYTPPP